MNWNSAPHLRSFWRFQFAGWLCFFIYDFLSSIPQLVGRRESIDEEAVPLVLMFLGSCALRPVCRHIMSRQQSWISFESKSAGASVFISIPVAFATWFILGFTHQVTSSSVVSVLAWSAFVLFMWCSLYFSIKQWQQSSEERERLLRAENELKEARLLALRYQLNPHFLFNSLNAVSTLILDGNSLAATRMLVLIGDLLRTSLDSEVTAEVTLSQELAFTEGYLAIEQTRLGDRLKVDMEIDSKTRDVLVPSMLLQPLVENAVRYGVAPLIAGGSISIKSVVSSGRLRVVVCNSGKRSEMRLTRHGSGIGLGNTAERLRTLYGSDCEFSLKWPEAGGCEVVVEMPLRRAEASGEV